jgi:hypothetical protein
MAELIAEENKIMIMDEFTKEGSGGIGSWWTYSGEYRRWWCYDKWWWSRRRR